jgi:uncharacterized protein HemX
MVQEPPRQPPQSAVQATGQVASDVVAGLKGQPMLLAIVILNALAIGVAVWFLRGLQEGQSQRTDHMLLLIEKCMAAAIDRRQDFAPPGR